MPASRRTQNGIPGERGIAQYSRFHLNGYFLHPLSYQLLSSYLWLLFLLPSSLFQACIPWPQ